MQNKAKKSKIFSFHLQETAVNLVGCLSSYAQAKNLLLWVYYGAKIYKTQHHVNKMLSEYDQQQKWSYF